MNTFKIVVAFAISAGVSALATYKIIKVREEKIAQEQINLMREEFKRLREEKETIELKSAEKEKKLKAEINRNKASFKDYTKLYSGEPAEEEDEEDVAVEELDQPVERITIISVDDYIDDNMYSKLSFTLYSDGVLADEADQVIAEIEDKIGEDNLRDFMDDEDEFELYIRNDYYHADYEILKVLQRYDEIAHNDSVEM